MVVVVNVSGDGSVVVVPLLAGDDAVAVLVAKASEELNEDLLISHLTALHLGVHARVVDDAQVSRSDGAITVLVEFGEALVDDLHAGGVGGTTDAEQEFVVADDAILVCVEVIKEQCGLIF